MMFSSVNVGHTNLSPKAPQAESKAAGGIFTRRRFYCLARSQALYSAGGVSRQTLNLKPYTPQTLNQSCTCGGALKTT